MATSIETPDNRIFDTVFRRYYASLLGYAGAIVGSDDAKDVVQEVFAWLLQHPEKLNLSPQDGDSAVFAYLIRSVYHGCLNHLRSKKTDKAFKGWLNYSLESEYAAYDPDKDPLIVKIFKADMNKEIERCLKELPDRCREVFILNYLEGIPRKRVAEATGLSVSTVDNHLYNALSRLRGLLSGTSSKKLKII